MTLENVVLVVGGTLTGLLAGLLFDFAVAIVPALRNLKGKQHIEVMQAINVKIINPVFMLSFLGPSILLPLSAFMHRGGAQFPPLVAAAILHIIGVNGITILGNVPLNDRLDKLDVSKLDEAEAEQSRRAYHGPGAPWMRLHTIRTLAAVAATVLVFIACLSKSLTD